MKQILKYLKRCVSVMVVLMVLAILPVKAEAANYQLVNVSIGQNGVKTKVGSYYFWSQWKEGKGNQLFASKSATAKTGTLLATPKQSDSSGSILTNGVKVYYVNDDSLKKHTLYEVGVNGKNRKKDAVISGREMYLVNYYNDQIYYNVPTSNGYTLSSYSVKTKKTKTLVKNVFPVSLTGGDRYICMDSVTNSKITVQIYDCKLSKVIKKHTIKKSSSENAILLWLTQKYVYCPVYSEKATKIYRCAINGSGSIKLFTKLGEGYDFGTVDNNYIYYSVSKENKDGDFITTYYRMKLTNKKASKITEKTYNKVMGWV